MSDLNRFRPKMPRSGRGFTTYSETSDTSVNKSKLYGAFYNFDNSSITSGDPDLAATTERYLHIDSRDRDCVKYPNDNEFRIKLHERYENIIAFRVISVTVPKTDYNVNEFNNVIEVEEVDGTETITASYTVTLPVGNYTAATLAAEFSAQMIAASIAFGGSYGFIVTINTGNNIDDKISITAGAGEFFRLLFSSGVSTDKCVTSGSSYGQETYIQYGTSARAPLGFNIEDYKNYTGSAPDPLVLSTITAPNKVDLSGELYVLMDVTGSNNNDKIDSLEAVNCGVNDTAYKIQFDVGANFVKVLDDQDEIHKVWRVPKEFNHFDVKFKRFDGRLYNFRGHHVSMVIGLTELTGQLNKKPYKELGLLSDQHR